MDKTARPKVILCDLDGVVWLDHVPVPGSVEAVNRAEAAGVDVLFVTNNSFSTVSEQESRLAAIGIDAAGKVVTSAMSAASVLSPGDDVLVCGGSGLQQEVRNAGCAVTVAHEHPGVVREYSAVVVGLHREFDYGVLADAMRAVTNGARLIGSNADNSYPTPGGPVPGGGSILAAIATASGVVPTVTGKPHDPMARLVRAMCPGVDPAEMVMIGDKPSTDGAFADRIGCRFAFVLTGVGAPGDAPRNSTVAPDMASAVASLLAG